LQTQIGSAYPEPLCYFSDASTVFRLAQSVDDGSFEIADFNRLLFRHPVLHSAKKVTAV
jgi:hypothetical protein